MSYVSKEQIAHDLSIAYSIYLSSLKDSEPLNQEEFYANYKQDYELFLESID